MAHRHPQERDRVPVFAVGEERASAGKAGQQLLGFELFHGVFESHGHEWARGVGGDW